MKPSSPYDSGEPEVAQNTGTIDLLMDMELPVMVRFGSTRMLLRDLLKLTAGSIVEFSRSGENPVEILVNKRIVARGSAVVVEGNYGVRIAEVVPDAAPAGGRES
jgi:flagellar motor switch protein FliN/FliY